MSAQFGKRCVARKSFVRLFTYFVCVRCRFLSKFVSAISTAGCTVNMAARKAFQEAWETKFPGAPVPTNLSFLDDEGVSALATALDGAERTIKKLEQELARQQFIYDFVLQQLNISLSTRTSVAARRSLSPADIPVAEPPVSQTPPAGRPEYRRSSRPHGKSSQFAAVKAMLGIGKVRPAIDPEDEAGFDDSGKKSTPLSRFYDKSSMTRASSEPSLLDCDRKYKPQPAVPANSTSRMPPGFKPVFTKEKEAKLSPYTNVNKTYMPGSSASTLRKSASSDVDSRCDPTPLEPRASDAERYLETDLDSVIPPSLSPPPRPPPPVDRFTLDVCDGSGLERPRRARSHIYAEPREFRRATAGSSLDTEPEVDDDDEAGSSDEEPIYFNLLLFNQQTLHRANELYSSTDDERASLSGGSRDGEASATAQQRRLRRMAHHYEYIEPQLTKRLSIPADHISGNCSPVDKKGKCKGPKPTWRHNSYTAAAAALCVTDKLGMQPIGCGLSPHIRACILTAKQPHALLWSAI